MSHIQLRDIYGQTYTITTTNYRLVTEWLAEYLPLMANNYHMPWQLDVWPTNGEPANMQRTFPLNYGNLANDLEALAKAIRAAGGPVKPMS